MPILSGEEMKKYSVIYADPPWRYDDPKGNNPKLGGITYPTMSQEDICNLPVSSFAADDCTLLMWATMPKLPEALEVINAWGFKYKTCAFVWVKLNPNGSVVSTEEGVLLKGGVYSGLGHWVNGNSEIVLLANRGKPKRLIKNVKQIVLAPRGRHSQKPAEIRNRIEVLFEAPYLELFARDKVEGWDSMGFDIDGCDIQENLDRLITL